MTDVQIDAGTLLFSDDDTLTATYLLVPYGEKCRSNLGEFAVDSGTFSIPSDLTGLSVNLDHTRENPVASFTRLSEQSEGTVATFAFAKTDAGRAAYLDAKSPTGKRRHVSAEVAGVKIKDGKAIAGRIFGAALVERPAFPSATLLAMAADTLEAEEVVTSEYESSGTSTDGEEWHDKSTSTEEIEDLGDGKKRITRTTVSISEYTDPDETETDTEQEEETLVAAATVTNTKTADAASDQDETSLNQVATLLASAREGDMNAETLLAALTDIKTSGAGALPIAGVLQPAWLGELWQGRSYTRKYIPLIKNGNITAVDEKGFVVTGTDALVAPWAGNKVELPTGSGSTAIVSSTFQRWGWAADIAREFFDIPGNTEVIEAFLRRLANSYAKVTDEWTLAQLVATATGNIVAPEGYPAAYPAALGQLIQGIEAVEAAGDTPSFAIVNAASWKDLLYTPKDQIPEFITFNFGITEGSANGTVHVVKGDIGIDATPASLVGARNAAHVNELPGASPLNLNAIDIARGGIDRAIVGYTQYMAEYEDALVLVGTPDAP